MYKYIVKSYKLAEKENLAVFFIGSLGIFISTVLIFIQLVVLEFDILVIRATLLSLLLVLTPAIWYYLERKNNV